MKYLTKKLETELDKLSITDLANILFYFYHNKVVNLPKGEELDTNTALFEETMMRGLAICMFCTLPQDKLEPVLKESYKFMTDLFSKFREDKNKFKEENAMAQLLNIASKDQTLN